MFKRKDYENGNLKGGKMRKIINVLISVTLVCAFLANYVNAFSISDIDQTSSSTSDRQYYINASTDDRLEKRANSYGYAMRFFYAGSLSNLPNGRYEQQPGEFYYSTAPVNNSFAKVWRNVQRDATALGYDVTGITLTPTNSSSITSNIPSGNARLVILVYSADLDEFDFFMRDKVGNWTHKPYGCAATNMCPVCVGSDGYNVVLNDSNVLNHLYCDSFTNALSILYSTDSPAIVDRCHGPKPANAPNQLLSGDLAGDHPATAGVLSSAGVNLFMGGGEIDYKGDIDTWLFVPTATGSYKISITKPTGYTVEVMYGEVTMGYPISLGSGYTISSSVSSHSKTVSFTQNKLYGIQIYRQGSSTTYDRGCTYSINIQKIG